MFFGFFQVLHLIGNQVCKFVLSKQWRIYNIFYISLLEQDIIKKWKVDKKTVEQLEFSSNNREYKMKDICNSTIYAKKLEIGYLLDLQYVVS